MATFGKGINQLNLAQITFLCSIPNNQAMYDPMSKMDRTIERRDRILGRCMMIARLIQLIIEVLIETITLSNQESSKNNYVETFV